VGSPGVISEPVLSPDQKWVAFPRRDNQLKRDLWLLNLERGNVNRLTTEGDNTDPVWSPDGKTIAFDRRLGGGRTNVYVKAANGDGEERLLVEDKQNFVDAWSPDGRYILFIRYDPKTKWDEWALPMFGDRKPIPYNQTQFDEGAGTFSPDGKWVAYYSNESGKLESYLQSFPAQGSKVQISNGGGGEVRWRRDGKELFYIGLDQELMSVEVKVTGNKLTCGVPRPLFKTDVSPLRDMRNHYDVSADGQRFLFAIPTQKSSAAAINVVINWYADLKR
jgi:Tol biopolymer transport system component